MKLRKHHSGLESPTIEPSPGHSQLRDILKEMLQELYHGRLNLSRLNYGVISLSNLAEDAW